MKVCTIMYSQLCYALTSFFQFAIATLVLAALISIVTASAVEVRAPVDLDGRVRICPPSL
jgi:hypothetical protein